MAPGPRIALAQINPTVGDLRANGDRIVGAAEEARRAGAGLVIFPELCLPGYPAEDLYLKRHFLDANAAELGRIAAGIEGIAALVGFAEPRAASSAFGVSDAPGPRAAFNSLALLSGGSVAQVYRKHRLPNYSVFDEQRYFEAGTEPVVVEIDGIRVGLTVCEDLWEAGPPASDEVDAGAQLIVCPSASPYYRGKRSEREAMFAERARELGVPIAFCNLVGGQDELVFDGSSFLMDEAGEVRARAGQFSEELIVCELGQRGSIAEPLPDHEEIYTALVLGLRDYVSKNGFEGVVLGISGGIDSALVALIAADALGGERVTGVVMPSPHSSDETQEDARALVRNLGANLVEMRIEEAMAAYDAALAPVLGGEPSGVTAENLQARIRGNLLMALSNANGWLVLTTGNKSEMSVGYATLYGDMAGGLAVIKDVPKTVVYELTRRRNQDSPDAPVPAGIIERPPSAELRPDQRDEDSLPPYDVLDPILAAYVEQDRSRDQIVAAGFDAEVVDEVMRMVDRAEYKRRQAPPGIRITAKAFGRDRRQPITNRFRG